MKRLNDIEIFIRNCPNDRLLTWIETAIGSLGPPEDAGDAQVYPSLIGAVIVTPVEDGTFTGVWFNISHSPWLTDVDCARQATRELMCVVRCDPGQHFPEVHPASDVFLEVDGDVENLVSWG
jgi:hypothetical protein